MTPGRIGVSFLEELSIRTGPTRLELPGFSIHQRMHIDKNARLTQLRREEMALSVIEGAIAFSRRRSPTTTLRESAHAFAYDIKSPRRRTERLAARIQLASPTQQPRVSRLTLNEDNLLRLRP